MTGPDHYREAERLLDNAKRVVESATSNTVVEAMEASASAVAAAQVHASLAHAAATERLAMAVENLPTYEGMLSVYNFGGSR